MLDYSRQLLPVMKNPAIVYQDFVEQNFQGKMKNSNIVMVSAFANLFKMCDKS